MNGANRMDHMTVNRMDGGRGARRAFLLLLLLPGVLFLSGCIVIPIADLLKPPVLREQVLVEGAGFFRKEKVAIIELDGLITARERGGLVLPVENAVGEVRARLDRARNDPQVKAVVLRISSPGGEVTACDVLHHEVAEFKKSTGMPVVASIGEQGTSGAYYVAMAADLVIAHPTAVVGSIGVILQHFDLSGLLGKVGVAALPVKSAAKKDLNSLFRPMTEEERTLLQSLVDDMYERFVDVVDGGRSELDRAQVLELADGRVVSGIEAEKLRLVDRTGYLADALEEARKRALIESATHVRYTRLGGSGANIYTSAAGGRPEAGALELTVRGDLLSGPQLYYLWRPGL
jgi:protease-4